MRKNLKSLILLGALLSTPAMTQTVMDPDNPTCPLEPNWSNYPTMKLTPVDKGGVKVLLAEGVVDKELPTRLSKVLKENPDVGEIWFRSPGGHARAGNEAGRIIRKEAKGVITRIPKGWSCFSACNFVFMGGQIRMIDKGGHFMVHMFTMTNDRDAINYSVCDGFRQHGRVDQRYRTGKRAAGDRRQRLPDPNGRVTQIAQGSHVSTESGQHGRIRRQVNPPLPDHRRSDQI